MDLNGRVLRGMATIDCDGDSVGPMAIQHLLAGLRVDVQEGEPLRASRATGRTNTFVQARGWC